MKQGSPLLAVGLHSISPNVKSAGLLTYRIAILVSIFMQKKPRNGGGERYGGNWMPELSNAKSNGHPYLYVVTPLTNKS